MGRETVMRKRRIERRLTSEGELFKRILADSWHLLHPDIQARFAKKPRVGEPLFYEGTLSELSCSFWGKLLGRLTMPFVKGALLPFTAYNFPVEIQVYSKENLPYIFKQRIYHIPNRRPIQFTSYMRESEKGEVLEYVGCGFGMKLNVAIVEGNLHFQSDGYFWDIGLCRIPIPDIFSPGKTYLTHRNKSPEEFEIRIDIEQKIFGKMFVQAGVFREIDPPLQRGVV